MSNSSEKPFDGVTVILNEKPCKLIGTEVVSRGGVPQVQFGLQEVESGATHALEVPAQDVVRVWGKVSGVSGSIKAFTDEIVAGGRDIVERFRRGFEAFKQSSHEDA